ncbi:hypothetical protein [Yoonia sp. 2307UL14-13]|uniref:hypothetical protein n=1 Tax=Yoonia sp. 2307UL14-13 TaxID=3126506 RepID=UPI0030A43D8D
MRRIIASPLTLIAALLSGLAVAAPAYNAVQVAPRSVFLILPRAQPEPTVSLRAVRRASGNWVLWIDTTDFQFTTICVAEAGAVPVGHAHVIRNGIKITSAYHPVVDLGPLPPGEHRISATLRGQDHRALLGQGGLLQGEITIRVPRRL